MKCYIYQHYNRLTGKSYIGKTTKNPEKRFRKDGVGYFYLNEDNTIKQTKFATAILKYGWEVFDHNILEIVDVEESEEREKYYIEKFDSFNNGYNSTIGGDGGCLGYRHTEENKRKISENNSKRTLSEETKRKISEKCKGNKKAVGHKVPDKQVEFIKNLWLGKEMPDDIKNKITTSMKGNKNSIHRYIMNIETGKIYRSINEASRYMKLSSGGSIGNVLAGRQETAAGCHWRYCTEEEITKFKNNNQND